MAPKGFGQLMIIVVTNPNTNLHTPVLAAFLSSKTKEVYQLLFSSIKTLFEKHSFVVDFSKIKIYCDFEQALRAVLVSECQGVSIVGCFFHYVKALWHKAAKSGLKKDSELTNTKKVILQLKILAHLSRTLKQIYWDLILKSWKSNDKIMEFLNYYFNTWLKPGSPFENAFDLSDEICNEEYICRTNNISEGYNNRLQIRVKDIHPLPIWLIRFLKEEEKLFREQTIAIITFKPGFKKKTVSMHYDDLKLNLPILDCMEKIRNFLKSKKIVESRLNELLKIEDDDLIKLNNIEFENILVIPPTGNYFCLQDFL